MWGSCSPTRYSSGQCNALPCVVSVWFLIDAVRGVYLDRAARFARYRIVDAGQQLDEVQQDVRDVVTAFMAQT